MTTQPPDLKKLREVALAATPGPWQWHPGSDNVVAWNGEDIDICAVYQDDGDTKATGEFIATFNPQTILALLAAYEASARDAEAFRAALEVEQVDLDFTIQAIVCRDPLEEIHLRVRDQKRRVTDALNAARHATQGD